MLTVAFHATARILARHARYAAGAGTRAHGPDHARAVTPAALAALWLAATTTTGVNAELACAPGVTLPVFFDVVAAGASGVRHEVPARLERDCRAQVWLPLEPGVWHVRVVSPVLWIPERTLNVVAGVVHTPRLTLWPSTTLDATWRGRAPAPAELMVHFRGAPSVPGSVRVPEATAVCPLQERRVTCRLPASRLDLRFVVLGMIPEYFWDVDLPPGKTSFGGLRMERGASLIGYVQQAEGDDAEGVTVELQSPNGKAIAAAGTTRTLRVTSNRRGFFQFRQAPAGRFRVVAGDGRGSVAASEVEVESEHESALSAPLLLEEPYVLDVSIDPPRAPRDQTWTLVVLRRSPFQTSRRFELPESGMMRLENIGRGQYLLEVSAGGQKWASHGVEIDAEPGPLQIQIPVLDLHGTVSLGGEPLAARLSFGGRSGEQVLIFESDDEGEFEGHLPRAGAWHVHVFSEDPPVESVLQKVQVDTGVDGSSATVQIELQAGRLTGRVVDEQGRGQRGYVNLTPLAAGDQFFDQVTTDSTGRFDAGGLSFGDYAIRAHAGGRQSRSVVVSLSEARDSAEVSLTVSGGLDVPGRIFSAATGQPVAGARILAFPADQRRTLLTPTFSDAEGRFELRLPPEARAAILFYSAEGHALEMARRACTGGEELVLSVAPQGGRLALTLPESTAPALVPALVRNGAVMGVGALSSLLRASGTAVADGAATLLEGMAPGEYALCLVDRQVEATSLAVSVDGARCATGWLGPGGELSLALGHGSRTGG